MSAELLLSAGVIASCSSEGELSEGVAVSSPLISGS